MELFWQKGYGATSMSDLVEHMGLSKQSLYNTFGDKRALFLEALDAYAERHVRPLVDILEAPGSPMGNLSALIRRWQELAADGECRGCMLGNTCAEFGNADPEIAARLQAMFAQVEDTFSNTFERAQAAGALADGDPRLRAYALWAAIHGVDHFRKRDPRLPDDFASDRVADELLGALIRGWGVPDGKSFE